MNHNRPGRFLRLLLRLPNALNARGAGWLLGHRFLQLTHVGRRSGKTYQTVLEVVGTGPTGREVIALAGFGRSADWYRNLQSQPGLEVRTGRERFRPDHRELEEREAMQTLASYERSNRFVAPVIHRVLSWLVGWTYDGSEQARRRLAQELPMVAFRPAEPNRPAGD